jgi:hypothetical protein
VHVSGDDRSKGAGGHIRHGESAHPTVPLDQRRNGMFRRDRSKPNVPVSKTINP